jgi:hypothetical protein
VQKIQTLKGKQCWQSHGEVFEGGEADLVEALPIGRCEASCQSRRARDCEPKIFQTISRFRRQSANTTEMPSLVMRHRCEL